MENVASFLQYGGSPCIGLADQLSAKRWEPTAEELAAKEKAEKKQKAKDTALVIISTAEKLLNSGFDVDTAFEKASQFFERSKLLLAEKLEE